MSWKRARDNDSDDEDLLDEEVLLGNEGEYDDRYSTTEADEALLDEPRGHGHDDEPHGHGHDDEPRGHGHDDADDHSGDQYANQATSLHDVYHETSGNEAVLKEPSSAGDDSFSDNEDGLGNPNHRDNNDNSRIQDEHCELSTRVDDAEYAEVVGMEEDHNKEAVADKKTRIPDMYNTGKHTRSSTPQTGHQRVTQLDGQRRYTPQHDPRSGDRLLRHTVPSLLSLPPLPPTSFVSQHRPRFPDRSMAQSNRFLIPPSSRQQYPGNPLRHALSSSWDGTRMKMPFGQSEFVRQNSAPLPCHSVVRGMRQIIPQPRQRFYNASHQTFNPNPQSSPPTFNANTTSHPMYQLNTHPSHQKFSQQVILSRAQFGQVPLKTNPLNTPVNSVHLQYMPHQHMIGIKAPMLISDFQNVTALPYAALSSQAGQSLRMNSSHQHDPQTSAVNRQLASSSRNTLAKNQQLSSVQQQEFQAMNQPTAAQQGSRQSSGGTANRSPVKGRGGLHQHLNQPQLQNQSQQRPNLPQRLNQPRHSSQTQCSNQSPYRAQPENQQQRQPSEANYVKPVSTKNISESSPTNSDTSLHIEYNHGIKTMLKPQNSGPPMPRETETLTKQPSSELADASSSFAAKPSSREQVEGFGLLFDLPSQRKRLPISNLGSQGDGVQLKKAKVQNYHIALKQQALKREAIKKLKEARRLAQAAERRKSGSMQKPEAASGGVPVSTPGPLAGGLSDVVQQQQQADSKELGSSWRSGQAGNHGNFLARPAHSQQTVRLGQPGLVNAVEKLGPPLILKNASRGTSRTEARFSRPVLSQVVRHLQPCLTPQKDDSSKLDHSNQSKYQSGFSNASSQTGETSVVQRQNSTSSSYGKQISHSQMPMALNARPLRPQSAHQQNRFPNLEQQSYNAQTQHLAPPRISNADRSLSMHQITSNPSQDQEYSMSRNYQHRTATPAECKRQEADSANYQTSGRPPEMYYIEEQSDTRSSDSLLKDVNVPNSSQSSYFYGNHENNHTRLPTSHKVEPQKPMSSPSTEVSARRPMAVTECDYPQKSSNSFLNQHFAESSGHAHHSSNIVREQLEANVYYVGQLDNEAHQKQQFNGAVIRHPLRPVLDAAYSYKARPLVNPNFARMPVNQQTGANRCFQQQDVKVPYNQRSFRLTGQSPPNANTAAPLYHGQVKHSRSLQQAQTVQKSQFEARENFQGVSTATPLSLRSAAKLRTSTVQLKARAPVRRIIETKAAAIKKSECCKILGLDVNTPMASVRSMGEECGMVTKVGRLKSTPDVVIIGFENENQAVMFRRKFNSTLVDGRRIAIDFISQKKR